MDIKFEQAALKVFCLATKSLFDEKIDDASVDLTRIISLYPSTLIALKSRFLLTMIILTNLYVESILTEAFSAGIKELGLDNILAIFNQNRLYYINNYDTHLYKRTEAFTNFKKALNSIIDNDNFSKINMYIGFCPRSIQNINPMKDVNIIKKGIPQDANKLNEITENLRKYILLTMITDIFDIEFKDELSTLKKHKLDRVEFYDTCIMWLKKFYDLEQHFATGELMRKCCKIVIGLTNDSGNPARQRAYELFQSMGKNYLSNLLDRKELVEKDVKDIEDITNVFLSDESSYVEHLIKIATCDERIPEEKLINSIKAELPLPIEIDLETSEEIVKAKYELIFEEPEEEKKEEEEETFDLKIEFE